MRADIVLPAFVALLAGSIALLPSPWRTRSQAPATEDDLQRAPCAADVLSSAGGFREGDRVSDWSIVRIACREPHQIRVVLSRASTRFTAIIADRGRVPHLPPVRTDHFDLFYSRPASPIPDATIVQLLERLAARVRATERNSS